MRPPFDGHMRRVWLRSFLFGQILTVKDVLWAIDNPWSHEEWSHSVAAEPGRYDDNYGEQFAR